MMAENGLWGRMGLSAGWFAVASIVSTTPKFEQTPSQLLPVAGCFSALRESQK